MPVDGKTRRDVLTEFRRDEILQAARAAFAERGYRETTLDDIAARAQVAKGTLYLYFDSKEAIFWQLLEAHIRGIYDRSVEAAGQGATVEDKIRGVINARLATIDRDTDFMRVYLTEFAQLCKHPGQMGEEFKRMYMDGARVLEQILAAGVAEGSLRPVPTLESAMALLDLIRSVATSYVLGLLPNPGLDLGQFVFDLYWNGVRRCER